MVFICKTVILFIVLLLANVINTKSIANENRVEDNKETAFTTKIDTASNSVKESRSYSSSNNNLDYSGDTHTNEVDEFAEGKGACKTDQCKSIAQKIKAALNTSADPCDDFYTFACGSWKESHKIPASENEITSFTVLTKEIESSIHTLLKADAKEGESAALEKARKFFASCMDTDEIEKLGAKPALNFIRYIGNWSICDNSDWQENHEKWDVHDVLTKLQRNFYPAPPFFTVEVTNDHLNSTKHLIKVSALKEFS